MSDNPNNLPYPEHKGIFAIVRPENVSDERLEEFKQAWNNIVKGIDSTQFISLVRVPNPTSPFVLLWDDERNIPRITHPNITELQPNEVFVFGANRAGKHRRGAALTATSWGAIDGCGRGLFGQTYALPTKNERIQTLSLVEILNEIKVFEQCVKDNPTLIFKVTEVGCGLAGYSVDDIAPLFCGDLVSAKNVHFPISFWQYWFP